MRKIGFKSALLSIATLGMVPLLLGFGVNWESSALVPETVETVADGFRILLSNPIVWLCCLAFFFHVPVEAAVATWATTLMTNKGVTEERSAILLSAFWLTFLGSRLVTALTLPAGADGILVLTMAGCCILMMLGIVLSRTAGMICTMVILAGLVLGPIFPTLIAILFTHVDKALHGRAVGLFFCIGGIGWTVIPMIIGSYAERTTVQRAFLICTASATMLTILSAILLMNL
jgi:fucose permease